MKSSNISIVAIGASAGGLDALQHLLSNLPAVEDACLIVAQHLSPSHKSILTQLLNRETELTVVEATSKTTLKAGMVYITPPDREISVEKGKIVLRKESTVAGPKPSVNVLFNSLAKQTTHRVVGVILSGTGSDGAQGVVALHEAGGYVIVQSPETAKFDSMPKAAIQTGVVDEIVSVNEIGASIQAHLLGKKRHIEADTKDVMTDSMSRIFYLLGKRTGADFSNYKPGTVARRLEKRLSHLGISDIDNYVSLIERDPSEADEMFKTILIGVTTFFRDPDAFSELRKLLESLIADKRDVVPIRVWVPGCSTGQEAYSIAMMLNQILTEQKSTFTFQIFATDIDDRAIAIARRGLYPAKELDSIPELYHREAITLVGDHIELSKSIRSRVLFSKHDLLQNPPFLKLDLVSCRNVLIYFNATLQQRVFPAFQNALKTGGILFLGKSETIGGFTNMFGSVSAKYRLYRRKQGAMNTLKYPTAKLLSTSTHKPSRAEPRLQKPTLNEMVRETLYNAYEHPYVVVNESFDVLEVNGDVRLIVTLATGQIQSNLLKMVHPDLQLDVRSALAQVQKLRTGMKGRVRRFEPFGPLQYIRISALPVLNQTDSETMIMVIFETIDLKDVVSSEAKPRIKGRVHELEQELASTKLQLETYIEVIENSNEELQSLNEELQGMNEEFQSSNEELETSNEELQSANEEIQITYSELKSAHEELEARELALELSQANAQALLNNDLQAFVMVDSAYKVQRFNHKADHTFRQLHGRTIAVDDSIIDLLPSGQVERFMRHFKTALSGKPTSIELEVTDAQDQQRWFAMHFSPAADRTGAIRNVSIGVLDVTDLKIALSTLNSSERLVNAVFNATSNGICITDENGMFVDMNDNYCTIYGYAKEELIGTHFTRKVAPEHEIIMRKAHDDFILDGIEPPGEFDVVDKMGNTLTVKVSAELLIDPDGKRYKVTSIENITEFKRSQADLLKSQVKITQSEAIMAEAQRFAKMGSWNFDFRTDSLTWTDALYDVFGADRETFTETHKSFLDLIHPDDRAFAEQTSKRSQETGEPFNITYRITTPTGELRIIEEFGYTEKDESGRVVRLFGTAQDVTDRNRAEQRYRSLVENGGDAIAIIGADGRPSYVSPSITKVLGYSEEEALNLNLFTIIHPDDVEGVSAKMAEVMQHPGVPIQGHTSRTLHKDGSWRWLEATITNMFSDPNIKGIVDNFRDVTDSVLTSRLEQLERVMMEDSIKEGADLDAILTVYLRGIESNFPQMQCTIMMVQDGRVLTRIAPSLEPELWKSFDGKPIGPNHGSCGTAAHTGKLVIVSDIAKDPLWKNYRKVALKHGMKACWSQPIFDSKGRVMATFANYYTEINEPSEKELELFHRSASLLGVIMESHHRSQALYDSNERFEYVTKATSDAIYDWDVVNDVFTWGDGFHRLFGYPKSEEPFRLETWNALTHPDDRQKSELDWQSFFHDSRQNNWTNSFRFLRSDGSFAYVDEIGYLIRDTKGVPIRMIGVLRDVSADQLIKIQRQLQRDLSDLFKTSSHLENTLSSVLAQLTGFCGYEAGEIWIKNHDETYMNLISTYSIGDPVSLFHNESKAFRQFEKGYGLPGFVWKNQERLLWNDIDSDDDFLRRDAAKMSTLKSAVGIPLTYNGEAIGALILFSVENQRDSDERLHYLRPLESFLGAEIKRKQQEEELHNYFTSSPDILAIASRKGQFIKVNPAFCTITGYTAEELTSKPFEHFVHPDDRTSTQDEFDTIITQSKHSNGFLNRYVTKSGDPVWISWSTSDVFGENGFTFAYGRNVTEMIRLQELFDNAAKLAVIGSWEVDLVKGTVFWSDITRVIHEVDKDFEPDLSRGLDFYRPDVRPIIEGAVNTAIQNQESWDLELPIITAKGNERWVRTIGKPEFRDGTCVRIFGSFQDIHQRKQSEELVRETNERFQIVTEATNDAIWDYNVVNNDLVWGRGFLTQFGYDPDIESPSFNHWASLIHPEDRERIITNVDDYFRDSDRKNWYEEYRFLKSDGTYAAVIDRAVMIRNAENEVIRVVGAMTDITYRITHEDSLKRLNHQLEKHAKELEISNAELEQFAYVASHDLQEPLRMITSFLSQLEKKYSDRLDPKAHQYIHFAVDGASRMRGIILDLLEFSRIGRLSSDNETFQLKDLVDEYQLLRAKLIQEKSALVMCGKLPVLNTHRSQVAQVMNNLLDNAIKYAKTGVKPEIRIQSKKNGAFWEISVSDNGIGISNEYFDKIFVIFQRLHDKTQYSGTGMGLAIVKKIVDNLGGSIWVSSVEGKGSTFTFTIPTE